MSKNPLTNLAKFITARKHEIKNNTDISSSDPYRNLLLEIAAPLGNMFSDELDDMDDLIEYLKDEKILSLKSIQILKQDKALRDKFEEGIQLGQEEDEYEDEDEEDFMFEDGEWGTEDDYNWPESDEDEEDDDEDMSDADYGWEESSYTSPLNI